MVVVAVVVVVVAVVVVAWHLALFRASEKGLEQQSRGEH